MVVRWDVGFLFQVSCLNFTPADLPNADQEILQSRDRSCAARRRIRW